MKFSVATKDLRETLARLGQIPGSRATVPIVKLTAGMDGLTLTRITPDAMMRSSTHDSEIEAEGEVEVDFVTFSQLSGSIDAVKISAEQKGDTLILKGGSSVRRILIIPSGSSPTPPEPSIECETINLPIEGLRALLDVVSGASGHDATDVALMGVCARTMFDGRLHFIASNRRAMHVIATEHPLEVDTLIPNEVISAINSAFSKEEGMASLGFHENGLRVLTQRVELFASVSEAKPPNFETVLKMAYDSEILHSITIDRLALLKALKSASPVASGDLKAVDLQVDRSGVTLSASNGRDAEISDRIDCTTKGEGVIRFGAPHLIVILESASGEEVTIRHIQTPNALLLRQEDRAFTVGVMKA